MLASELAYKEDAENNSSSKDEVIKELQKKIEECTNKPYVKFVMEIKVKMWRN